MKGARVGIDVLFLLVGIIYLILGKVSIFVSFLLTVYLHETAHMLAAKQRGFVRGRIRLTPFGARYSESSAMPVKSDVLVSLAGIAFNAAAMAVTAALWWLYPNLYVYTRDFFAANAAVLLFNILPVYPLDGARVAIALSRHDQRVINALKALGIISGILMMLLGIISVKYAFNASLIITGVFLSLSNLIEDPMDKYVSILHNPFLKDYREPIIAKRYIISPDTSLNAMIKRIRTDSLVEFELRLNGRKYILTEDALYDLTLRSSLKASVLTAIMNMNKTDRVTAEQRDNPISGRDSNN